MGWKTAVFSGDGKTNLYQYLKKKLKNDKKWVITKVMID